jgi:hypothetical protein
MTVDELMDKIHDLLGGGAAIAGMSLNFDWDGAEDIPMSSVEVTVSGRSIFERQAWTLAGRHYGGVPYVLRAPRVAKGRKRKRK